MIPIPRAPSETARIRNEMLSSLPIPIGVPEDTIRPIIIQPPYTLQDFLVNAAGVSFPPTFRYLHN